LDYQGTWNAQTNTPTLSDSSGKKGQYYIVSASGNTNLSGISTWESGDWAIHNGSNWQKMDAADKEKTSQLETQINTEITNRQAADAFLIPLSQKGTSNGVATLDATGIVPTSQLPVYYSSSVGSVNNKTGAVTLNTDDISEGSVNLYFTSTRAKNAAVINSTNGSETDQAASVSAIKAHITNEIGLEITNRQSSDSSLQTAVDTEVASRQSADSSLQSQINTEIASRQGAVSAEASARTTDDLTEKTRALAAESTLQVAISTEQTRAVAAETSLQTAINAEITARQAADAAKVDSANATADGYKISQAAFVTKTSSYTLTSSENGKVVLVNSASAVTITVPSGLSIGFSCTIVQLGAGQVTIAASGTTLNSVSGLKIVGQHGAASVISYDTNIFNVSGATTAW
jgi:hypothetical protein